MMVYFSLSGSDKETKTKGKSKKSQVSILKERLRVLDDREKRDHAEIVDLRKRNDRMVYDLKLKDEEIDMLLDDDSRNRDRCVRLEQTIKCLREKVVVYEDREKENGTRERNAEHG